MTDHPAFREGVDAARLMAEALAESEEVTAERALLRELAAAVRTIVDDLHHTEAPEAELRRALAALHEAHQALDQTGGPPVRTADFVEWGPFVGRSNPLALPIRVRVEGEEVVASACFTQAYEGPPGCVHGGFIAAVFDDVLGFAQGLTGRGGMTGRLMIRYRRPTPLGVDLRITGHVAAFDGRKIQCRGTMHAGDVLTAEAEALFVAIDPDTYAERVPRPEGAPDRPVRR